LSAYRAEAVALPVAPATSPALPCRKPRRPLPSPTTTSAAKPKRLPPFTVLDTRLMWTSFSISSSPPSSSPPRPRAPAAPAHDAPPEPRQLRLQERQPQEHRPPGWLPPAVSLQPWVPRQPSL